MEVSPEHLPVPCPRNTENRRMILQTLWMGSSVRPTKKPLHFRVCCCLATLSVTPFLFCQQLFQICHFFPSSACALSTGDGRRNSLLLGCLGGIPLAFLLPIRPGDSAASSQHMLDIFSNQKGKKRNSYVGGNILM